jgi:flagellar hook protein FlgE
MSINSALMAGVSGLVSNSSAMAAISNNIANVNTTAFKRTRSDFTHLVNAQGLGTSYNAGGVTVAQRQLVSSQGSINQTNVATDLALQGQGFFVVKTAAPVNGNQPAVNFSRVGSFAPNQLGDLVNQSGHYLQGWRIDSNGEYKPNAGDLSVLENVNLNVASGLATASKTASIFGNLRASQPVRAAEATYDASATTNNMASGAVNPDANWSFQVYDSRGGTKSFTVALMKSSVPNEWHAEIFASNPSQINSGAPLVDGQVAAGTLVFSPNGQLDLTATSASLLAPLSIGAFAVGPAAAGTVSWGEDTGVDAQEITLELGQTLGTTGTITQFDSPTAQTSSSSDGSLYGETVGVEIDRDGFVSATYSNGVSRKIYKLAIATFNNPDGLSAQDGGSFQTTRASGNFTLKEPGTGGAGVIEAAALEASGVDLALEFSNMIITQRAYSASSKIITTADEMMDELIRMKR